jgi:hypothetical protein
MGNNTTTMHLALQTSEDVLDPGVPNMVNSLYTESAHIALGKNTSRNTQKRIIEQRLGLRDHVNAAGVCSFELQS